MKKYHPSASAIALALSASIAAHEPNGHIDVGKVAFATK